MNNKNKKQCLVVLKKKSLSSKDQAKADYSKDLRIIVSLLIEEAVFIYSPGRHCTFFSNFIRDPLSRLGTSNLFQWINRHTQEKTLTLGEKQDNVIRFVLYATKN